jgi:hypothetical protein
MSPSTNGITQEPWDEKIWSYANLKAAREHNLTSASKLNDKAAEIIGLSEALKSEKSDNGKLRYRVVSEWSRTALKNKGFIVNTEKGEWALTPKGREADCFSFKAFIQIFKMANNANYISQSDINKALSAIRFKDGIPAGSAKTNTSLIFQTLAFHAAARAGNTGQLEIQSGKSGRKILTSEYVKLVGADLSDDSAGFLSTLGVGLNSRHEIKTNKDASGTLSSNFFTNVQGRNTGYGDFIYDSAQDRLSMSSDLAGFTGALEVLDQVSIAQLMIIALRAVRMDAASLPITVSEMMLRKAFGDAGGIMWKMSQPSPSIVIANLAEEVAKLTENSPKSEKDTESGLSYEQRLICALAAKPFVILAGGTGTGKSKCAIETVIKLTEGRDQYEFVPVGADWTDTRPLLGFENLLISDGPKYSTPTSLSLIIKAHNDRNRPYFLILDEMNLSHVERYFSDFLSKMEAGKVDVEASMVKLHGKEPWMQSAEMAELKVPSRIPWPSNLSIIGTVNIDETTHMFSPKVLDRAHVIEFKPKAAVVILRMLDHVNSLGPKPEQGRQSHGALREIGTTWMTHERGRNEEMKSTRLEELSGAEKVVEDLQKTLAGTRFAFSHRTAQETVTYVAISMRLIDWCKNKAGLDSVFDDNRPNLTDLAVIQKILPKINGSDETLKTRPASQKANSGEEVGTAEKQEGLLEALIVCCDKFPESRAKLIQMIETLKAEHFVSFIQ